MILNTFLFIIGLILIIISSDLFVASASNLATSFKVPKMVIALTIASFCTCAPELAISFNSISSNNYDLTLANVIGSCIVNILLIVGCASIIKPVKVTRVTIVKELPLLTAITGTFCLLFLDNELSRNDAIVLIILFIIFCIYLYRTIKRFHKIEEDYKKISKIKSTILTIISLIIIVISSEMIVNSALYLSEKINIETKIISMFLIVIGTSLPELMITLTSAKKGEFDMAIGNIIGTNIFNICIVLGLPILIYGNIQSYAFNYLDLFIVFVSALMFYLVSCSEKAISRIEGIIMILLFICYYYYLIII